MKSADYFCSNPAHRQTDVQNEQWRNDKKYFVVKGVKSLYLSRLLHRLGHSRWSVVFGLLVSLLRLLLCILKLYSPWVSHTILPNIMAIYQWGPS